MQFINEEFKQDCETTIGVEFASKTFEVDTLPIKLQIWDTVRYSRSRQVNKHFSR